MKVAFIPPLKFLRKARISLVLTASVLIAINIKPASALSLAEEITRFLEATYNEAETYLSDLIDDTFGDEAPYVERAVREALGELGVSDPRIVRDIITQTIGSDSDLFDLSLPPELIQAERAITEINRDRARAQVQSVLSKQGQEIAAQKLELVAETVLETDELAIAANEAEATQTVVKIVAAQTARKTQLLGASIQEQINARLDSQFQLEVMTDLSQTLSQMQSVERNRQLAGGAAALAQAAQINLVLAPGKEN